MRFHITPLIFALIPVAALSWSSERTFDAPGVDGAPSCRGV